MSRPPFTLRQRMAISDRYFRDGATPKEIAKELDLPVRKVHNFLVEEGAILLDEMPWYRDRLVLHVLIAAFGPILLMLLIQLCLS